MHEGENYEWFEGVNKDDDEIAYLPQDELCRKCNREIEDADYVAHTVIGCNMCNFVWCCKCLSPPITAAQCASPFFFACSRDPNNCEEEDCVTETKRKIAARSV